jgi:hypothetical protein
MAGTMMANLRIQLEVMEKSLPHLSTKLTFHLDARILLATVLRRGRAVTYIPNASQGHSSRR